jgi:hypothetical protein
MEKRLKRIEARVIELTDKGPRKQEKNENAYPCR